MTGRLHTDDRAVSVAITHVLTIGITAILISGLMIGAGSMLDSEKERGAQTSLETTGERLSGEISSVDRLANGEPGNVNLSVNHPRQVSGSTYTIEFDEDGDCDPLLDETDLCLTLTAHSEDANVQVPVVNETAIDTDASVRGGPITVKYDGDAITLESGHR
ncbi:hypothetical protein OB955_03415 [Halobacteria archaeon AArc-m2/3/4]|uniref:Flagellin n=1 Tax=Natronoglomus mannanivorans TaxID=2979990 RepID=A0ABT2QA55_9EURY|nr:hypothetical protein [Halobacteria archaeon AArc-m2/3/4]